MYDELVKSLRQCAVASCAGCKNDLVEVGCRRKLQREAADAIEELSKQAEFEYQSGFADGQIAANRKKPRWIPVTERLPEIRKVVLITDGVDVGTGWVNQGWWNTSFADIQRDAVTHWMPLPQPPKEKE